MDFLDGHVVKDIGTFEDGDVSTTLVVTHLLQVGKDTTVQVDAVVVEPKGVLGVLHETLLFRVPTTLVVVVYVVKPGGLEVLTGFPNPLGVGETTEGGVGKV